MKLTTERVGFYLCCVLSAAPLLFAHYPPMVDLPQHAAQIATLNNLSRPDFAYKGLFTLEWARPYLGGYLVIWALSQVVSVLTAVKISIALTVITIPMTAAHLRAHFNADPRWDWLLLTIGYGFAFQWGLVNFSRRGAHCLALPGFCVSIRRRALGAIGLVACAVRVRAVDGASTDRGVRLRPGLLVYPERARHVEGQAGGRAPRG